MKTIRTKALASEVYEELRTAIFSGELPMGARIDTDSIAKTLGVSRQPVKDALTRLRVEGLVVIRPRSGTFVRTISVEDAYNILSVRQMMESFAISHLKKWGPAEEATLMKHVQSMLAILAHDPFDWLAYNACDQAYHQALVALAGNSELDRLYKALHSHLVSALFYFGQRDKAMTDDRDHLWILNALREGRWDLAAELISGHINSAINGLEKAWSRLAAAGRIPAN